MESCLVCIASCWEVQTQLLLHCLAPPGGREEAECALRYWESLGSSAGCGSLRQKSNSASVPQSNLFLNIFWTFLSFFCVPNHVHQVSLPFWVIAVQDLDDSLEEKLSQLISASLAVICTLWSPRPQVALLLGLPHFHLGLGQRIPAVHPHHVLHRPLLFHTEIKHTVQVTVRTKRKRKKIPKPINEKKNCS